jgi:hypothetical protein
MNEVAAKEDACRLLVKLARCCVSAGNNLAVQELTKIVVSKAKSLAVELVFRASDMYIESIHNTEITAERHVENFIISHADDRPIINER